MVDLDEFEEGETTERIVEELTVGDSAARQRIIVPHQWGAATLLATAERGNLLLYSFTDMPHLLCWRLPEDEDILIELIADDDDRASRSPSSGLDAEVAAEVEGHAATGVWVLPEDIDEERLRYPAAWGRPAPLLDAWLDGGPILLSFADGLHTLRWALDDDTLLSLIADDTLTDEGRIASHD